MAAMKLYYGKDLVGGDVDLDEFEQLKTDVAGKYDKGDPGVLENGTVKYDNAALMEKAVLGNTSEIATLRQEIMDSLIPALNEGGQNIIAEFTKYFPIYGADDTAALMYENAADMGLAVAKNIQDISTEVSDRAQGDAATLASANKHSDDNDAVTLAAANKYTDGEISKIPGVDGIEEVEKNAVRNANAVAGIGKPGEFLGGVVQIATVAGLPDTPDPNTLYIVRA